MSQFELSPNEVAEKSIIVTGAGSGIGRAIVEVFAAPGTKIVAVDACEKVRELESASIIPLQAPSIVPDDGWQDQASHLLSFYSLLQRLQRWRTCPGAVGLQ